MSSNIRLTVLDQANVYLLTFDRPGSSVNLFDKETLLELDDRLKAISGDTGSQGLIFASAKPTVFHAGADLRELAALAPGPATQEFLALGQRVMERVAGLQLVTVAALHGACLGGGLALALACDYRLASADSCTRIGTPVAELGLIPVWGGCTRLPGLAGIEAALDMTVRGLILGAREAHGLGLVDELIPRERQIHFALEYIARGRAPHRGVGRCPSRGSVERAVRATRGHPAFRPLSFNPAAMAALDVTARACFLPVDEALRLENATLEELLRNEAARNLLRLYEARRQACRRGHRSAFRARRCAIVGGGVMGSGLAHGLARLGLPVLLQDVGVAEVGRAMARVAALFDDDVRRGIVDGHTAQRALDGVIPVVAGGPLRHVDIVLEAVVERAPEKAAIFGHLGRITGPHTILASTTAGLSIANMAAASGCPERVVGLHFLHPVRLQSLVEVVKTPFTAPEVIERTLAFVRQIDKVPVVVADRAGFLVNRILYPCLMEAASLCQRGQSVQDVDEAMLAFGMPVGPLRLLDEIGIDLAAHVAGELREVWGDRMAPPELLLNMVREGQLGRKSGAGFYAYHATREPVASATLGPRTSDAGPRPHRDEMQRRMVLLMVNEAARCLEEQAAEQPGDIDLALTLAGVFPAFRGGPLTYADQEGLTDMLRDLMRFAKADARFQPAAIMATCAARNGSLLQGA